MQGNGNIISMRRNISRTSSQKSGDKMNPEGVPAQQNVSQLPRLLRYQSFSITNKQSEFSFNQNNNQNKNGSFLDGQDSNPLQHNKQQKQAVGLQDNNTKQSYNKYKQMCKDIQFIQMLGNPRYIVQLYDRGYFYSTEFKDYINGLRCFLKSPNLMKLIKYPEGLYNLQAMLKKGFVQQLQIPEYRNKFIIKCLKRNLHIRKNVRKWKDLPIPQQTISKQN